MRPCAFLLLLPLCGYPHRACASGGVPVAMEYRDFADVQSFKSPSAPLQVVTGRDADGGSMTSFVVAVRWHGFKPGQTFRDGAHIAADQAAHKGQAAKLRAEARAWKLLLRDSPVFLTQAELEPQCEAHLSATVGLPVIGQTFTPLGAEKFARFTMGHIGDVIGIIVDGRVLSAPLIMEPITDGRGEISGGFGSLAEAQALADRLNGAAGRTRKP